MHVHTPPLYMCINIMQVARMSQIKTIYSKYVEKLVKCLPMDDTLFITKLSAQQLLPGDTESKIKTLFIQADKASYFLNHVIKPALVIDDMSGFEKLLSVMQECEYKHVKMLSSQISNEAGNVHFIGTHNICMHVLNKTPGV